MLKRNLIVEESAYEPSFVVGFGGQVPLAMLAYSTAHPLITSGKAKLLGVTNTGPIFKSQGAGPNYHEIHKSSQKYAFYEAVMFLGMIDNLNLPGSVLLRLFIQKGIFNA